MLIITARVAGDVILTNWPESIPLLGLTIVEDVVLESQQFFGEDIGTWWTWPHLISYVWRLFGSILKKFQLYCWLLAIPIHEPSVRPATTWGLQISRWWRKTWTKLRLFAMAKVQGHQTDGASQSYWKVKPACKAVQTTHIPIHLGTLSMTPKVEFKVYPHVSHVSHVRVSKRLMGYSQPSQAFCFFFCWLFHPNHHHQHCKASDITSAASGMSFPRQAFCRKWGTTWWHGDLSATKCNESPINQQLGPTNHPLAQDCSSFWRDPAIIWELGMESINMAIFSRSTEIGRFEVLF